MSGCTAKEQKSPEEIRQETAEATAKVKSNVQAVAQGIREGLKRDNLVDLNKASRAELRGLPGMTEATTTRVIAGRPYDSSDEVVSRHILTESQYDQIKDHVEVKK